MRIAAIAALLVALAPQLAVADDDFGGASVIFARGSSLFRTDPKGKAESEIATIAAGGKVRALRTDATGTVLLADVGGKWSWMKLDGSASTLTELPCADGPAQLAEDGACVLCRSTTSQTGSVIVNLATNKAFPVAIPAPGARLIGTGPDRRLVWADQGGIWTSPPGDPKKKTQVAPEAPLRSFLPSSDGARAVGVYLDKVFEGRQTKPAEVLMNFALDGQGARRKAIKSGVPVEWSHDNQWVLIQDRGSACIMGASGGQYKCWKGYTGASIASDGKWALVLGDRSRGSSDSKKDKKKKSSKKDSKKSKKEKQQEKDSEAAAEPSNESENRGEGEDSLPTDDVEVPPPSGPLALYRGTLLGPYTTAPALIVRVVDGAAVWVPGNAAH